MAESNFIQSNGIPLRIAACNCLLGQTRDMADFVEADEEFTNWEGIVGASLRDPSHIVIGVKYVDSRDGTPNDGFNDNANALCTILQPFQNYPASIPVGSKPDNLVVKARGKIQWKNGSPIFPAIKISLRPYKCYLDYVYQGNFNKSGQGEVGYETKEEQAGGSPADDLWDTWMFEGDVPPNFFVDNDNHYATIANNGRRAERMFNERGKMLTLNETHYFKNADRPADEQTPWEAVPDYCPNPTLYPRADTGEPYNFKRNESYDFRYRFPSWWFEQSKNVVIYSEGSPIELPAISFDGFEQFPQVDAQPWQITPVDTANVGIHDNPFFDPKSSNFNVQGIAPVIKGFYIDGDIPEAGGWKALAQSTSVKSYKYIRKRYSFSFSVEKGIQDTIVIPDNTVGAQGVFEVPNASGFYLQRYQLSYTVPLMESLRNNKQTFDCECWWRMEISAPLAEWNWDDDNETGTTISGWIILKKKVCDTTKTYSGFAWVGGGVSAYWWGFWGWWNNWYYGYGGSFPISAGSRFIFSDELGDLPAGEIPWSVTVNRKTAKMKDDGKDVFVPFFDFPIGGEIWVSDGQGGLVSIRCGDPIENGMSYISDFVVTSISLP
jgi:hypothetical protein